jgi:hypothetical protein
LNEIVVSEEFNRRNPEEELGGGAFVPFSCLSDSTFGTAFRFKGAEAALTAAPRKL